MQRGFKTRAEGIADDTRRKLGLRPSQPMDTSLLAAHVDATLRSAEDLTSIAKLRTLDEIQSGAFSACTFDIGDRHVIIYNPLSSLGRRNSDIAHEVAHLLLNHTMNTVETVGSLSFFTCDAEQEQEANWLAGCLLLPRRLLFNLANRGMSAVQIAEHCELSVPMAEYRLRTTGVARQLNAKRGATNLGHGHLR
jgi:Zn-dependent peptidase ImmA (M78 family)